jgi:hypothetical protein
MNKVVLFIVLLRISAAYGENPCNTMYPQKSGEWGIGFIWVSANLEVPVYDKPDGQKIGILSKDKYGRVTVKSIVKNFPIEININDFVWAGHRWYTLLKVYGIKSQNFCNIFTQSTKAGLWINQKEFKDSQTKFLTYSHLLTGESGVPTELNDIIKQANLGVNLSKSCVNLRAERDVNSEKITCLTSNDLGVETTHTHLKVLEIKDNWFRVQATVYAYDEQNDESGEGCSFKETQKYSGWLKAVDEKGFPNIWYSVGTH